MAVSSRRGRVIWGTAATLVALIAAGFLLARNLKIVDTKEMQAKQSIRLIEATLERYRKDHGRYPAADERLDVLVDPSPQGRYFVNSHGVTDPWGHMFVYKPSNATRGPALVVYSIGPNGIDEDGGGDDVVARDQ